MNNDVSCPGDGSKRPYGTPENCQFIQDVLDGLWPDLITKGPRVRKPQKDFWDADDLMISTGLKAEASVLGKMSIIKYNKSIQNLGKEYEFKEVLSVKRTVRQGFFYDITFEAIKVKPESAPAKIKSFQSLIHQGIQCLRLKKVKKLKEYGIRCMNLDKHKTLKKIEKKMKKQIKKKKEEKLLLRRCSAKEKKLKNVE